MDDLSMSGQAYNRFDNLDGIEARVIHYLLSTKNKTDAEKAQVDIIRKILCYDTIDALNQYVPDADTMMDLIWDGTQNKTIEVHSKFREICACHELGGNKCEQCNLCSLVNHEELECDCRVINGARCFNTPRIEDAELLKGTVLKVYVDSIIPDNHILSTVNIGIDIVTNNNVINLSLPDDDIYSEKELLEMQNNDAEGYNNYIRELLKKTSNNKTIIAVNKSGEKIIKPTSKIGDIYASLGSSNRLIEKIKIEDDNDEEVETIYIDNKSRITILTKAVLSLLNGANVQGVGKIIFSRKNNIFNQAQYGIWNRRDCEGMKIVMGVKMGAVS